MGGCATLCMQRLLAPAREMRASNNCHRLENSSQGGAQSLHVGNNLPILPAFFCELEACRCSGVVLADKFRRLGLCVMHLNYTQYVSVWRAKFRVAAEAKVGRNTSKRILGHPLINAMYCNICMVLCALYASRAHRAPFAFLSLWREKSLDPQRPIDARAIRIYILWPFSFEYVSSCTPIVLDLDLRCVEVVVLSRKCFAKCTYVSLWMKLRPRLDAHRSLTRLEHHH